MNLRYSILAVGLGTAALVHGVERPAELDEKPLKIQKVAEAAPQQELAQKKQAVGRNAL